MNKANTQFWVAIIGMTGLVVAVLASVAGTIWGDSPTELTYMLVGGLLSSTGTSIAWLFRLNGAGK